MLCKVVMYVIFSCFQECILDYGLLLCVCVIIRRGNNYNLIFCYAVEHFDENSSPGAVTELNHTPSPRDIFNDFNGDICSDDNIATR